MFAVIEAGGKQYIVSEGRTLKIEKIEKEAGDKIEFDALLIAGDEVKVGQPTVAGAKITAVVVEQGRAKKVSIIKYKAKSRYRRNVGHRQPFTEIKIESIVA
ncbi:50S ribosomal protein L21 [Candidatus Uhrbacteria bacterium CG_4_10_14_0_2_um_filter_41_7]|uniref:Large ribosomal subunit protein bL21 n=1 Tax=Candidatus Uhrbacteria bacterium CG_4_9_14_3_um_filter_41_35 TaxID=1975034 RepID=A0A2M7XDM3_9BACT|nr:MAG: 50S ribosomal protein L21 [Candidatus Uhrbacteria bacterium CG11_big_fil_rev_8_21_14_0_20_41_9]PIZ55914.1 MAG: 50S ribosomal protein L21 [Candidatus Uhrbacteria bacterium CG_4_10_14_0_2_um_filter_41_7]PJA45988.1 MAG: 50S ribosomal protein L21 [Candidatus Uhrbacteria bacterium CG_4_9_14_3_um_filter_41_35]